MKLLSKAEQQKLYRARLIEALELMELGRDLMFQKIKRENPNLEEDLLVEKFNDWLNSSNLTQISD